MKELILLIFFLATGILKAQDTKFVWAKSIGGNSDITVNSISTSATGSVYVFGTFKGTVDFDPNFGVNNVTAKSGVDNLFILKLNLEGDLVWVKTIQIPSQYISHAKVDEKGETFITGSFSGVVDFDPDAGVFNLKSTSGDEDLFILKMDSNGNFLWAKNMGGGTRAYGVALAVDDFGNVYTTGEFVGKVDFDPGARKFEMSTANNTFEVFVSKLDVNGDFCWANMLSGNNRSMARSIAVDMFGNVYAIGEFLGIIDFDPGFGEYKLTADGLYGDSYFLKLNTSGDFLWAKKFQKSLNAIVVTDFGNSFVSGTFEGSLTFNSNLGAQNFSSNGVSDILLASFDHDGNCLWVKAIGGKGNDGGNSINTDINGDIYYTGFITDTVDVDPGVGVYKLDIGPNMAIVMLKLNSGGEFVWARKVIMTVSDSKFSSVTDKSGNVYSSGFYRGTTNFNTDNGILNLSSTITGDVFIHKMSQVDFKDNGDEGGAIIIFPNPTSGKLNIYVTNPGNNSIIEIYSAMGMLVAKKEASSKLIDIDISNQANGNYFIRLVKNKKKQTEKKILKMD